MPHIPGHEYSPQRRLSYGRTSQPEQPLGRDGKSIPRQARFGKTLPPLMPPVQPQPVEQDRGFLSDIWNEYLQPGLETAVQLPGVKQTLQGLEAVQQRAVIPAVSRLIEPIPIRFEERPDAPEVPWYDIPGQYGRGDISLNFDQYVTPEGRFSPAALVDQIQNLNPTNVALEVIGENLNRDFDIFEPETRRSQNVQEEARKQEQLTGKPVTQRDLRKIEEDLYKLPPGVRGFAEEAPWLFLPPARLTRASLQAVRKGQRLSSAGRATTKTIQQTTMEPVKKRYFETLPDAEATRLGVPKGTTRVVNVGDLRPVTKDVQVPINIQGSPLGSAAPVARAALRATEVALKPVELIEEGLAKVIEAPFRVVGKGAQGVNRVINKNQLNNLTQRGLVHGDNIIRDKSYVAENGNALSPSRKLFEINNTFERKTGIQNRYILEPRVVDGETNLYLKINDDAIVPDRVRINTNEEMANIRRAPYISNRRQEILTEALDRPTTREEVLDFNFRRPEDMGVQSYSQKLAQSPVGNRVSPVIKAFNNSRVKQSLDRIGTKAEDVITKRIKDRFPKIGNADWYVKFLRIAHDGTAPLRIIIDQAGKIAEARGVNPGRILELGKELSTLPSQITNSINKATTRATNRITNFYRDSLEPAIDMGVSANDIDNLARAQRYLEILVNNPKRKIPKFKFTNQEPIQPTKAQLDDIVDLENGKTLDGVSYKEIYSEQQMQALSDAVEGLQNIHREIRKDLFDEGIIDEVTFNKLSDYNFYAPIDYVDKLDIGAFASRTNKKGKNVVDDGIKKLSDDINENNIMDSLIGGNLFSSIARNEIRIQNNKVTKKLAKLLKDELGFKDVSKEFVTEVKDSSGRLTGEEKLQRIKYDDDLGSSYLSYYENGQRVVLGDANGNVIPKEIWQSINGRNGLALKGENEINSILAMSNGWFRSMFTTYNPLFWIRNMLIDATTAGIKGGLLPTDVGRALMRDFVSIAKNKEDKLIALMRDSGGWAGDGYIGLDKIQTRIRRELARVDQTKGAKIVTNQKQLDNALRQNSFDTLKNTFRRVGGAIESAPRQAVFKRSLEKQLGKDEVKRILNLSDEEFQIEMFTNYNQFNKNAPNTGTGFVNSPQAQKAAANSLEATLDFSRGGQGIKYLNNYILFLNAAMEGFKVPGRALGIDLSPVIRPVKNPTANGNTFEFGSLSEQLKKYMTLGINNRGISGQTFDVVGGGPLATALRMGGLIGSYFVIQETWNKSFKFEGTPLYYDIPEYIRYNSMIFMLPPEKDENGDLILDPVTGRPKPNYLVIPHRLREWNLPFQAATLTSESMDEVESAPDMSKWWTQIGQSTLPVSEVPMPEVFTVGTELVSGYDTWRKSPIVPEDEQEGLIQDQYDQQTSKSIREAAGILDDVPAPEPIADVIGSPRRLEHLYESVFGGVGTTITDVSDYVINVFNDLRNAEPRPMEEQVAKFRDEMNQTERTEFITSLTDKEYKDFQKELKEPKKGVPFITALGQSFNPQRGGAIFRGRQERLQDEFGFSAKETGKAIEIAREVNFELKLEQDENDKKLSAWRQGGRGESVLSPSEWREARSAKYDKYEGAMIGIQKMFKNSVQAGTPEEREEYYDRLYNASVAGKNGINLLVAEFKSIKLEETPDASDWDKYNATRNDFKENIRLRSQTEGDNTYNEFIRRLEADDTETEKIYQKASELLSEYWSIGNSLDDLYSGYSARYPQIAQQWNDYLNADTGTKAQLRRSNPQMNSLVKRRSDLRKLYVQRSSPVVDETLAFWYGDFYSPVTPGGREVINRIYGRAPSTTAISNVGFIPR